MPPKRAVDAPKDTPENILRIGKSCDIISWMDNMETAVTGLYGLTEMFFTTNEKISNHLSLIKMNMPRRCRMQCGDDDRDKRTHETGPDHQ
jgi:hypothetical protein